MRRLLLVLLTALVCFLALTGAAMAQQKYEFKLGFKMLAMQIPEVVGEPTEDEHYNTANGDSLQKTTTGLMAWRKSDNWTAFTNGARTWVNGPNGLQDRRNDERFPWESDWVGATAPPPPPGPKRSVPLGESRVVVTMGRQVEITILEVSREADERLRDLGPAAYQQLLSGPNDERVLIRLRLRYVDGPPGVPYGTDRARDFFFLQHNGASASVYLGPVPEPAIERGALSVGESKEGWIAAVVGRDVRFNLLFGPTPEERVSFALQPEPQPTPTAMPTRP